MHIYIACSYVYMYMRHSMFQWIKLASEPEDESSSFTSDFFLHPVPAPFYKYYLLPLEYKFLESGNSLCFCFYSYS